MALRRKKTKWAFGDVFLVPLNNEEYAIGQILDLQMPNIVRLALYSETVKNIEGLNVDNCCSKVNMISLVASSRELLDFNIWKIVGNKRIDIPTRRFPNEKFRCLGWIGAIHYDAALIEDFLNAYHKLTAWDDWYNPNFLDEFLISLDKKPKNLILLKV
jgi:hypothetical protein